MTRGFDVPRNWTCKKVKGKKMAVCSPVKKRVYHFKKKRSHRKHK